MAILRVQSLSYSYPDGTHALSDLSLAVDQDASVGIVGANGAGKSTLVNHLNGYLLPQSGSVSVDGVVVGKKTLDEARRRVGVVFQNPDDQLFTARVYDDVAFGPENMGMSDADVREVVQKTLTELGLWDLRDRPPSHMSQGQKRFAAFAAVLAMSPQIIVMDEPTSDLDPRNRRRLINLVNNLSATRITVSHDLDFIWETCSRVAVMAGGAVVAQGETRKILGDKTLLEANGLELPLRLQG